MSSPIARAIKELGDGLTSRWLECALDQEEFPKIALEALEKANLAERFEPKDFIDFILFSHRGRFHRATEVYPLYFNEYFSIDFHFWLDSIAHAHDHDWGGAVTVLKGPVLSAIYTFDNNFIDEKLYKLGRLTRVRSEIQPTGFKYAVKRERGYIHSLAYLERPGFAISIRSGPSDAIGLSYHRPGLGFSTRLSFEPSFENKKKILNTLYEIDERVFEKYYLKILPDLSSIEAFLLLREICLRGANCFPNLLESFKKEFGKEAKIFSEAFEEYDRVIKTEELRQNYRNVPEIKFFVSALFLSEKRADIIEFIQKMYPGKTVPDLVGKWLSHLSFELEEGQEIPEKMIFSLGRVIEGVPLEKILQGIDQKFPPDEHSGHHREILKEVYSSMQGSPIFSPLFN